MFRKCCSGQQRKFTARKQIKKRKILVPAMRPSLRARLEQETGTRVGDSESMESYARQRAICSSWGGWWLGRVREEEKGIQTNLHVSLPPSCLFDFLGCLTGGSFLLLQCLCVGDSVSSVCSKGEQHSKAQKAKRQHDTSRIRPTDANFNGLNALVASNDRQSVGLAALDVYHKYCHAHSLREPSHRIHTADASRHHRVERSALSGRTTWE